MSVILLRLEGPMQSWGIGSRFTERYTEAEPSKSGLIGLLCCALGRSREKNVDDLAKMKMSVRVDREGQISYDYHTTLDILRANAIGTITESKLGTVISRRFYIADACFLVALESSNSALLEEINQSLKTPKWPLYLGRKSFPASSPIYLTDKLINRPLTEVIREYPWQGRDKDPRPESLRLIHECGPNEGEPRFDVPLCFHPRRFRSRNVLTEFVRFKSLKQEG